MQVELKKVPSSFVDKDGVKVNYTSYVLVIKGEELRIKFQNKQLANYLLSDK